MRTVVLVLGALLAGSCASTPDDLASDGTTPSADTMVPTGDDDDDTTPPVPDPLAFEGIATLAWDGAGGLVATWVDATGPVLDPYVVEVSDAEGLVVQTLDATATSAPVTGLADGEYTVRVTAVAGVEQDDGDRSLTMLVGANRLVLRSMVPLDGVADVWGEGDTVVVAGRNSGASFYVFDVSDPRAPVLLHTETDGGYVKDLKIGDGVLFSQAECGCQRDTPAWDAYDKIGARMWSFTDPAAPVLVGQIGDPNASIHNLAYGAGALYLSDNTTNAVSAWDVVDPTQALPLWQWVPPSGQVHDQAWVDDKLYVAWWDGFSVWDVADPTQPVLLVHHPDPTPNIHNVWPTSDGQHVITTSEISNGELKVFDIGDPAAPVEVARLLGSPGSSVHNVHVRGDFAYAAWYTDGIVVLDVSDPANPVEVGRYETPAHPVAGATGDTGSGPPKLFSGAWGAWPFGDVVAVTDTNLGLFLFEHYDADLVSAE